MEPFLGQVLTVSFSYAPVSWALCNGQLLSVQQNSALYALLGTRYGGDGTVNFGLPNCAGRTILGVGRDSWNNTYDLGPGQAPPTSLTAANLPPHSHGATFTLQSSPAPTSVTLNGTISQQLNAPPTGGLGARSAGNPDTTPNPGDGLGQASVTVYAPSNAGAAVPLKQLTLAGTLTGTLDSAVTATASVPAAAGTVALGTTGASTSSVPLSPPPYLVQTVIIALQGYFPQRP